MKLKRPSRSSRIPYLQLPKETILAMVDTRGRPARVRLLRQATSANGRLVQVLGAPGIRPGLGKVMCVVSPSSDQTVDPVAFERLAIDTIGPGDWVFIFNPRTETELRPFHVQKVEVEER